MSKDIIYREDAIKAIAETIAGDGDTSAWLYVAEDMLKGVPSADRPSGEVDAVKEYERQVHNLDRGYITLGEFDKRVEPLRHLHYDRPRGEWMDVTDGLPKQGQDALAWVETKDDARIACCNYSNSVWFDAIMDVIVSPIAWMPLPMPYHKDERSRG